MSEQTETARQTPPPAVPVAETAPPTVEAELSTTPGAVPILRIHRMELSGFKSFSDRTEVQFPAGITAVVGPNGCGKSNIADAINWVLGQQSAKLLRGTTMQDVIFNGTEGRKALGMAEVSMHLVAQDGVLPGGRRESVITRRLFRDGESDYLLNGARTRLKDIQELLRAAHVGAKTYATIEQGRVDQILNAKPRDRRLIIEDAAGVSGFKHKRRLAELKLEATQANLLRVNDIITEVRRQINSLKRQAAKARRYQRLRERLRGLERIRFGSRARALDAQLAALRDREGRARDAEAAAAAKLATLEAEVASERQQLEEQDRRFREAARRFHQLEAEVDRKEERIRLCRERIAETGEASSRLDKEAEELAARRATVEEELRAHLEETEVDRRELASFETRLVEKQAGLDEAARRVDGQRRRLEELRRGLFESMNEAAERRNRRRAVEEAIERNNLGRARLAEENSAAHGDLTRLGEECVCLEDETEGCRRGVVRLQEEQDRCEAALAAGRERSASEIETLAAARGQEKSAASRLRTLEDVATRFAGVSDGVRMLLTSAGSAGVRPVGVMADFVEAGRQLESAAEIYLQGLLPAVILENDDDTARAASLLRSEKAGRTSLLSRTQPAGAPAVGAGSNGRPAFPDEILRDPRVLGRLRDHLKLKTSSNGFVQDRIGDAIVVDSLESALALHRVHPEADYLTPAGEVVYASGVVAAGGEGSGDHGLLAHTRKTHEASAQLAEAAALVATRAESVEAGRSEITRLEERLGKGRAALERARRRVVELEVRSQRFGDERERTHRRAEILTQEIEGLEEEGRRLAGELTRASHEVEDAERVHQEAESRLEWEVSDLGRIENEFREKSEGVAVVREELAVRRQRHETSERRRRQLEETRAELETRIRTAREDAEATRRRGEEAAGQMASTETELASDLQDRERGAAEISRGERAIAERREAVTQREETLRTLRTELDGCRQETGAAEVARARAEADRVHLDDLCIQELGTTADAALAEAEEQLEGVDPDSLEEELREIRDKIEKIGPVNMMAIEEFTGLEERDAFLAAQHQDLAESIESLRETIRRINRTSRERFAEAFEIIRRNYQEIFKVLFNGGRADLRLEEGEDVLECGIEILAQPPGKRLSNVQLLSGGEKAMAAIALLFAIFRHQPSPFCLLDEVDAALDDVNVGRYTRMLKEYAHDTQFIIITHNKLSMESADLLYGVTMEEPGVSKLVSLQLQ